MSSNNKRSIYDAALNVNYTITQLPDEAILYSFGFRVGQSIVAKRRYCFGGPVLIEADTSLIAIGKDMAKKIMVEEKA